MTNSARLASVKWGAALQDLAHRLDLDIYVDRYEFPERRRQIGDWWRNKEQWCVHLDYRHYAWLEGPATADPVVQRTISWSLEVLSTHQGVKWQDVLLEWAMDLSLMPREDLFRHLCHGESFPAGANLSLQLPGYFITLSVDESRANSSKDADTRALVSEVVEALLPRGWIAWLPADHDASLALVYACADDVAASDARSNGTSDHAEEPDALDTVFLMMRQLTQALAADALVSCRAAVGTLVTREQALYTGIATAIASWRTRAWMAPSDGVGGWGTEPAETLLLALPADGIDTFLRAAAVRAPQTDLELSAELTETLFGLIAANLNVSEASRLLYLHRNTLMNRIERIRQLTGFDVRVFRDAMTLWLVSAVHRMTQCP